MSAAVVSSAAMPGLQNISTSHNSNSSPNSSNSNNLTLNLNSKNPFRNRATSPILASPNSPDTIGSRSGSNGAQSSSRMSKNPFLDDAEAPAKKNGTASPAVNIPSDIFNDLTLIDKPANGAPAVKAPGPAPPVTASSIRGPPPANATGAGSLRPPGSPKKLDDRSRRPRGMSEVSSAEKDRQDRRERERESRPPRTESEERRRAARRKEREERYKRDKERASKSGGKTRRPQGLDIIDQLDVTGIYGQGLFHHDGPFDACNPHRNTRKDRKAPMQAFPANSANMQLGGSGPLNSAIDYDRFHGRGEEAFGAFNNARKDQPQIIDPTSRTEHIHGDESVGLGTSTFLEGAPASKRDVQRQEDDEIREMAAANAGGLSRKKSLAQKFRGMSSGRANRPMDLPSGEARFTGEVFDASPPLAGGSKSAGGLARASGHGEIEFNPFDNDYENAYEKKGAQIRVAEQETGRARAPSSPMGTSRGLVRTYTADSTTGDMPRRPSSGEGETSKTGFLSRMKSLKGGKRARPERQESQT